MDLHNEAWERVLAAVEADTRRARALVQAQVEEPVEPVEPAEPPLAVPADWTLPAEVVPAPAGMPALPPLEDMPPVPPHLRERIESLKAQIEELQRQLVRALDEWQAPRVVVTAAPQAQPVYVDRRL